ncbi:MAG: ABC transporter permease [Lachnospiraceae bacterium]|nr:ABC transporter permease [Lachnospiraceae bacterium]
MKQFGTILKFELKNYFKNKIFVGVTIVLVALIAVVMFFPRIMTAFESEESEAEAVDEIVGMMLLSTEGVENPKEIQQAFEMAFLEYEVCIADKDIKAIEEKVISGDAECAFVMKSPTSYEYYVNNLSMYDYNTEVADEVLQNLYQMNAMLNSGMSAEDAQDVMNIQIEHETTSLGKDQAQNFFYTYIMIFALYMVILLYGQMVATNVATEKSSRAMELLITSAKPNSMMFGKVIASCLAGLIQLVAVFGTAILFYNLNKDYWEGNMLIASVFDMPLHLLVYMLIFFVLGFFIYAFMFGAIGSLASKVEDINTSSMPLTLLFVAGFMVVMFSMTDGNVDSLLMRICSYVPFTSPMAMFTRIAMSTVPFYEILISIVVLIASVIGIGVFSAKIYRVGVLLYGTTPKIGAVLKSIKKA